MPYKQSFFKHGFLILRANFIILTEFTYLQKMIKMLFLNKGNRFERNSYEKIDINSTCPFITEK